MLPLLVRKNLTFHVSGISVARVGLDLGSGLIHGNVCGRRHITEPHTL